MEFTAKDFGYTLYSRLEEAFRHWLASRLLELYGAQWREQISTGVWENARARISNAQDVAEPLDLLDSTYLMDLCEIVCYRNAYEKFFVPKRYEQSEFQEFFQELNMLRAKVAHVRRSFTQEDLHQLLTISEGLAPLLGDFAQVLLDTTAAFTSDPGKRAIKLPPTFLTDATEAIYEHINNLPPADYEMEGGFIGRKEDLKNIRKYLSGNLYRVITVSGAGGVGKTALVHQLCDHLLSMPRSRFPFDAVVWVSAKEENLTVSGIEKLTPELRTYEDLIDSVLELFQEVDLSLPIKDREESFKTLLDVCDKGILFVVDNLETIQDEELIQFIKEVPPPHKVLITSRLGLGEIEKRYPLKSLAESDALTMFRCVAREKQLFDLASKADDILRPYIKAMACYPLAIKWVLGQVALGHDFMLVVESVTAPGADLSTFCFDRIFAEYLNDTDRLVLYALSVAERPVTSVILCHLSNLKPESLDIVVRKLVLSSLVINSTVSTARGDLETRYELLSLTRRYVQWKLQGELDVHRQLLERAAIIQHMLEESRRVRSSFRYSLKEFGAMTQEEQIAATWALTAQQRHLSGDYTGAIRMFETAVQFAPRFAPIYRNWASVEAAENQFSKARELMGKAVDLAPKDVGILLSWVQIEIKAGHPETALGLAQQAAALAPDDEIIVNALADAERRNNLYEAAEANFIRTLGLMSAKGASGRPVLVAMTARADNLRRWADSLRDLKRSEAAQRLLEAVCIMEEVVALNPNDATSQATRREIALQCGHVVFSLRGFADARRHYDSAVSWNPIRDRDKKITEIAAFIIADHLLQSGCVEEGRPYIELCKKVGVGGGKYQEQLPGLEIELSNKRVPGIIDYVAPNRAEGIVRLAGTAQEVSLHRFDFCRTCSAELFARLKGRRASVVVVLDGKKLRGRRAVLID